MINKTFVGLSWCVSLLATKECPAHAEHSGSVHILDEGTENVKRLTVCADGMVVFSRVTVGIYGTCTGW